MWPDERRDYHDLAAQPASASPDYVRRLREADALICQFPVLVVRPARDAERLDGPAADAGRRVRPVEPEHGRCRC